jgi:ABC-type multidrug transport system fused ATPase/permease subunit
VLAALSFMVGAKLANVGVPLLLKNLVDAMNFKPGDTQAVLVVPVALLLAYGLLRLSTTLFTELRELVFAKATEGAARRISLEVFRHLHALSLRFHLERQTGGMTRDIERGTRGVHSLISYSLYSIIPTLIEVTLVLTLLAVKFDVWFAGITGIALVFYIFFTVTVTEWRTQFRKTMNELDSSAHSRAIDSLLNYETVKYFNNEEFEAARYDESLLRYRRAAIKSQNTLSLLNAGQQLIIAIGLVAMLWRATQGVVDGHMTLGDLVMVNAFMIQLYIPLGFLGVIYREIKQSLTDLDKMFVLMEKEREIADLPGAVALVIGESPAVRFENVNFAYDPARPILHNVSFEIPPARRWRWSVPRAPASPRWRGCFTAFTTCSRAASPLRPGHQAGHAIQRAPGHRHRPAGHGAVQRHGGIQHRLRQAGRHPRRGGRSRAFGAHPRLHRLHAAGLPDHGGRARPEALGRREAARGHRPHAAEEPAGGDF